MSFDSDKEARLILRERGNGYSLKEIKEDLESYYPELYLIIVKMLVELNLQWPHYEAYELYPHIEAGLSLNNLDEKEIKNKIEELL